MEVGVHVDASKNVPLGRFGAPDEIAKAVVFLASANNSYVTGTELFVDSNRARVIGAHAPCLLGWRSRKEN